MPVRADSSPERAASTPASAARTPARAVATRVSEAKPSSLNFAAALSLICASFRRACASVTRACASLSLASASGRRARASASIALVSARLAWRVPTSRLHISSPVLTKRPLRSGSEITVAEVSARTSTWRSASVCPRTITALSICCALERMATTPIASSPSLACARRMPSSEGVVSATASSGSPPNAKATRASRSKIAT